MAKKIKSVDVDGSFEKVKMDDAARRQAEVEMQAKKEALSRGGGFCSIDGCACNGACRKNNSREAVCTCPFQCTHAQLFVREQL